MCLIIKHIRNDYTVAFRMMLGVPSSYLYFTLPLEHHQ